MHTYETRGAIRGSYVVLTGCGVLIALILIAVLRNRKDASMSSAAALAAISNLHGVTWPTNTATTAFAIWRYRASTDGKYRNTETLAKLETDEDSFSSWYASATNFLSEDGQIGATYDAKLIAKAKWWAPHELSDTNAVLLSHEINLPTGVSSKLRLIAGATGTNRVIYLHCHVLHP